jgi:glutaredoxin-related protein
MAPTGPFLFKEVFMKKLELFFFPQCPYCQVVMSALRVTGLEEKVTMYDIIDEPKYKQQLIKDTGRGTVPCLYIDGKPMHESADIAKWLHNYAAELQGRNGTLSGN